MLARIHTAELLGKPTSPCPVDTLWNLQVDAEIGPHPELSEAQKLAIERDYGMVNGRLVTSVRAALLPYWLLAMRIGQDDIQRDAMAQQIVLTNRNELNAFIDFG